MHSPRGNSILDMSTRSAQKRICTSFSVFYCSMGSSIFFGGDGPLSSQKSPFMFQWQNDVQSIFGLRIFVKAPFQINFIATRGSRVGIKLKTLWNKLKAK
jgi:hypothetical protein